jgi:hypothetical protein
VHEALPLSAGRRGVDRPTIGAPMLCSGRNVERVHPPVSWAGELSADPKERGRLVSVESNGEVVQ